MSLLSILINLL